ncbi:hypothetical protein VCRA2128O305_40155 [Vibrio crassostreae]|nr:hypothetical protein VCRA2113O324_380027 [Vibrio crassostreae]CAK2066023.1 hypothetical protein VCRA2111O320_370027 [Vibrio crassostreae]CAK2090768.1 hypothetical protein VCRA2110O173_30347 [Vibrio crassostreae]CAK2100797.1 hypothetical protein VCRA2119O245_30342 [Vibrio crassostreae]CAK2112653.1 hypothetical protein VCRA2113O207_40005 [Vibrio crassostreae]
MSVLTCTFPSFVYPVTLAIVPLLYEAPTNTTKSKTLGTSSPNQDVFDAIYQVVLPPFSFYHHNQGKSFDLRAVS